MYRVWIIQNQNGNLWQVTTETESIAEAENAFFQSGEHPPIQKIELLPEQYPTGVRKIFEEST